MILLWAAAVIIIIRIDITGIEAIRVDSGDENIWYVEVVRVEMIELEKEEQTAQKPQRIVTKKSIKMRIEHNLTKIGLHKTV